MGETAQVSPPPLTKQGNKMDKNQKLRQEVILNMVQGKDVSGMIFPVERYHNNEKLQQIIEVFSDPNVFGERAHHFKATIIYTENEPNEPNEPSEPSEPSEKILHLFYAYETTKRRYDFFVDKLNWYNNCPYNSTKEIEETREDVLKWRDQERVDRNELITAIKMIK